MPKRSASDFWQALREVQSSVAARPLEHDTPNDTLTMSELLSLIEDSGASGSRGRRFAHTGGRRLAPITEEDEGQDEAPAKGRAGRRASSAAASLASARAVVAWEGTRQLGSGRHRVGRNGLPPPQSPQCGAQTLADFLANDLAQPPSRSRCHTASSYPGGAGRSSSSKDSGGSGVSGTFAAAAAWWRGSSRSEEQRAPRPRNTPASRSEGSAASSSGRPGGAKEYRPLSSLAFSRATRVERFDGLVPGQDPPLSGSGSTDWGAL
mmetsp:Transcript_39818/g.124200  ORF Transcript_39818/g.124200 Transcript_39818/m.124200 type:complete len:265 (-) Transcript_39818:113-907(-)